MDAQHTWQAVGVWISAGAVFLSAVMLYLARRQVQHAGDAVRAMVDQSLIDRMAQIVRFFAEHPDVAKRVFSRFSNLHERKIEEFMSVHPFLLHFQGVLSLRGLLPKGDRRFYRRSMEEIFGQAPVLHEWMNWTKGAWSDELREIARRNPAEECSEHGAE